jgi:hypothetical protein
LPAAGGVTEETGQIGGLGAQTDLRMRIYDSSGALLQEWSSSPAIANEKWN